MNSLNVDPSRVELADLGKQVQFSKCFESFDELMPQAVKRPANATRKLDVKTKSPRKTKNLYDENMIIKTPDPQKLLLRSHPKIRKILLEFLKRSDVPKDFYPLFLNYTRIAVGFDLKRTRQKIEVGQSKLGGIPDLPQNIDFPTNSNGELYIFHGQLNLEELAPYQNYLPRKGMLFFFINHDCDPSDAKVLYSPTNKNLNPFEFKKDLKFSGDGDWQSLIKKPKVIKFKTCLSLPEFGEALEYGPKRYPEFKKLFDGQSYDFTFEEELDLAIQNFYKVVHTSFPAAYRPLSVFSNFGINMYTRRPYSSPEEDVSKASRGHQSDWMNLFNFFYQINKHDLQNHSYCINKVDLKKRDFSKVKISSVLDADQW